MAVRLTFDGQKLTWPGIGIFKATTGLPDLQWPDKQCVPDAAIPEGNYKLFIQFQGEAPIRNAGTIMGLEYHSARPGCRNM